MHGITDIRVTHNIALPFSNKSTNYLLYIKCMNCGRNHTQPNTVFLKNFGCYTIYSVNQLICSTAITLIKGVIHNLSFYLLRKSWKYFCINLYEENWETRISTVLVISFWTFSYLAGPYYSFLIFLTIYSLQPQKTEPPPPSHFRSCLSTSYFCLFKFSIFNLFITTTLNWKFLQFSFFYTT